MRRLLALLAVVACAPSAPPAPIAPTTRPSAVVLVSLDGFHPDYLSRGVTPRISALAARGVRARWMDPAFPTKTFPNHYTVVTGLVPDHHGIVANNMQDRELGSFSMSNQAAVTNGAWWGGEPIWVTAELQGKRAAAFFWPGSEAAIKGVRPTHWQRFDDVFPREARVDSVLTWLDVPAAKRPIVSTLYYSDVDWAGHRFGPASAQVDTALMRVDEMVGRLVDGLAVRGLDDEVNIILVSDHGMAPSPAAKVILLEDYIALDDVEVVDWTPVGMVQPKPGRGDSVYARLQGAHPAMQVYRKREVPARYRFGTHVRVPDLVLVADEGWTITSRERAGRLRDGGMHGYDNALASMRALFVAAGPAFREGVVVPAFSNVHVYELMAAITGLRPAPNDGARDSTAMMLRGSAVPLR